MAIDQTQVLPAPVLEAALTAFTKKLPPMMGQAINTGSYAPQVAGRNTLQTGAETAAGGLGSLVGTGAGGADVAGSIASYMSPYQQQVMDATMTEFDRNAAMQNQGLRDQAISMGAYGGGREGVQLAEMQRGNQMNRAMLQAQLLNQGFGQAQQARGADLMSQQGLGTYQSQLGQAQQGYDQAVLDANTMAAREAEYEPYTRLGLIGQQLAQIQPGAFPTTTVGYQQGAAPASPMASFLGGAAGAGGILGKMGIFG
tara:strand:+ start:100 stop:867 length:768 start_codon:yes stop_codon:yes gene_type:complete